MTFKVIVSSDHLAEDGTPRFDLGLESMEDMPGIEVVFMTPKYREEILPEDLEGYDAFIMSGFYLTKRSLEGITRLKVITRWGAGFENIDLEACTEKGIYAVNCPDGPTESVAQNVIGLMIACGRNFPIMDDIARGTWRDKMDHAGTGLTGKRLGILGWGLIGQRLTEIAGSFGMEISAFDPYVTKEKMNGLGVEKVDLTTLLEVSDYLSINCPLTEETEGLMGIKEFRQMKKTAYLINTFRGGVYRDEELARAFAEDCIAGAGIDVFENEPRLSGKPGIDNNPLLDAPICILLPHQAGLKLESYRHIGGLCSRSILQVFAGEVPDSVVNLEVLPSEIREQKRTKSFLYGR